jgi:flagellar protein FlaG
MKISTISQGVVLPAHVQEVAVNAGGGKPIRETAQDPEQVVPANHESHTPIEPVVNGIGLGLRFYLDQDTGIRVIEVVDEESGEIIRQIPPDEVVDFMRQFKEIKGQFVSRRY